ncbi:hypothetical protein STBA_24890 [Streptomyces sp. MP131-18]|nr:hypothetical protein STBA_24890 [Streptomyces sp. MP131-18]
MERAWCSSSRASEEWERSLTDRTGFDQGA